MKKNVVSNPSQTLALFVKSMFSEDEFRSGLADEFAKQIVNDDESSDSILNGEALTAGLEYLLNTDLRDTFPQLHQPLLWIHGELDTICPIHGFNAAKESSANNPHRQFEMIAAAGHVPFFTSEQTVVGIVGDFLDK